jgi:hypothetical protein
MIQAQIEFLIIAAIVCIIISPFVANLCTDFLPRQSGIRNDVHYFDAQPPESEHYKNCLISHGDIKNPQKNLNMSSCTKLDYTGIASCCPELLNLYFTKKFCKVAAAALGVKKLYLNDPKIDVNCIFLRKYVCGDHLAFHYDNNFAIGTRYTAVIPLYVTNNNMSEFIMIDHKNRIQIMPIPKGKGVVYNGWQIRHAITGQIEGEERIVVVVHLYDDPRMNMWGKVRKQARDITYKALSL